MLKILSTADLHQWMPKWQQLVEITQAEQPDVVIVAGDLFPKDNWPHNQIKFQPTLVNHAKIIKDTGADLILQLGNDDNQNMIPLMEQHSGNLWHYLPETVVELHGREFVGMSYVNDYPFTYKYWCRAETPDDLGIDPSQFGFPFTLGPENQTQPIEFYDEYLKGFQSLKGMLNQLAKRVHNRNRSVWLIHQPPKGMELARIKTMQDKGSKAVTAFIKEHQPLLTIHGHIHENFEYTKIWRTQTQHTMSIQSGQLGHNLIYNVIYLDEDRVEFAERYTYTKEMLQKAPSESDVKMGTWR